MERLSFKLESVNPTGAFKDRPISVALTKAVELEAGGVITASSGNAGAAVAAYAARAGLQAFVLVPEGLPPSKLAQIGMYGATLVAVRGSFSNAFGLALSVAKERHLYNITTTFLSAFPTEGNKTAAYELVLQLGGVPDSVVIPVGAGPLLGGMYKGFKELRDFGITEEVPRMIAVQADGCAPIARAYESGATNVTAWEYPDSVASGIADPLQGYTEDGTYTLDCVRESGGAAISVNDEEILQSTIELARREGILAEPTAAVGVAALRSLLSRGIIGKSERTVCVITGHGLKDPKALASIVGEPRLIDPNIEELNEVLDTPSTAVG